MFQPTLCLSSLNELVGQVLRNQQSEINSLRIKGINSDEIFSVLMKIMKKVESSIDLASMNSN